MNTSRRQAMGSLAALAIISLSAERAAAKPGFSLRCFATDWGNQAPFDEFCAKAKAAGFDGIEKWVSLDESTHEATVATIRKHGLEVGLLIGGGESDAAAHLASFRNQLLVALATKPAYVNCHSGRDWFGRDQN